MFRLACAGVLLVLLGTLAIAQQQAATQEESGGSAREKLIERRSALMRNKPDVVLKGHDDGITSLEFAADGELLASGSGNGIIKLWSVKEHKEVTTLRRHTASVRALAFSPDGNWLVSSGAEQLLVLWNVKERRVEREFETQLSNVIGFLADNRHFVTSPSGMLQVYSVDGSGPESLKVPGLNTTTMDVDGKGRVLVGSRPARVLLWDPLDKASRAGRIVGDHERPQAGKAGASGPNMFYDARFLKDGSALISDGLLWRWNLATDKIELYAALMSAVKIDKFRMYSGDKCIIYADSSAVQSAELKSKCTASLYVPEDVHAIAISPTTDLLAVGHGGGWDDVAAWFAAGPTGVDLFDLSGFPEAHRLDAQIESMSESSSVQQPPASWYQDLLPWQ